MSLPTSPTTNGNTNTVTRSTRPPLKVVIIGAGLAGLTAAYIFSRRGHNVTIYDSRPSPPTQGAGIMLRPNASRVLSSWGLAEEFDQISDVSSTTSFFNLATGEAGERRVAVGISDFPDWGLGRNKVHALLLRLLNEGNDRGDAGTAQVVWGTRCEGLMARGSNGVRVRLKGGRMRDADLAFVADGAHSRLRKMVLGLGKDDDGSAVSPQVEKGTNYTVPVPVEDVQRDEHASTLLQDHDLKVWIGGKDCFVVQRYQRKDKEVTLSCWVGDDEEQQDMKGFADEDGDIKHVRKMFEGRMCLPLWRCLELATTCSRWKLNAMPDLDHWVGKGGRIALLGDSAHSMLPSAAQGYSQIIEDIGVLDYLLHQLPSESLPKLLQMWQEIRIPRVNRIKAFAAWNSQVFTGVAPPSSAGSDGRREAGTNSATNNVVRVSLHDVKPNKDAPFKTAAFLKWVMDHDAITDAKIFIEAQQGKPKL